VRCAPCIDEWSREVRVMRCDDDAFDAVSRRGGYPRMDIREMGDLVFFLKFETPFWPLTD
jgi:hypothetical protein